MITITNHEESKSISVTLDNPKNFDRVSVAIMNTMIALELEWKYVVSTEAEAINERFQGDQDFLTHNNI